jgi:hypothetical protein
MFLKLGEFAHDDVERSALLASSFPAPLRPPRSTCSTMRARPGHGLDDGDTGGCHDAAEQSVSLNVAATTAALNGNRLTLNLAMTFNPA